MRAWFALLKVVLGIANFCIFSALAIPFATCVNWGSYIILISFAFNYATPSSGEAYRDRQLTTNFELWVEIFCVPNCQHVSIWGFQNPVCLYPEKRNHPGFVNISLTLVNKASLKRSLRVLQHGNRKIWFCFQKSSKLNFVRTPSVRTLRKEIALASSISVLR